MKRTKSPGIAVGIIGPQQWIDALIQHFGQMQLPVQVVSTANAYEAFLSQTKIPLIDLLFMAASQGPNHAFSFLEQTRSATGAHIVLLAGDTSYAYQAIQEGIGDYLLYPFEEPQPEGVIKKWLKRQAERASAPVHTGAFKTEHIVLSNRMGFRVLKTDQISHLEAKGSYCRVWLINGEAITLSKNMSKISSQLQDCSDFIRIHKSYTVNKNHIISYDNQNTSILLSNNIQVSTSLALKELLACLQ